MGSSIPESPKGSQALIFPKGPPSHAYVFPGIKRRILCTNHFVTQSTLCYKVNFWFKSCCFFAGAGSPIYLKQNPFFYNWIVIFRRSYGGNVDFKKTWVEYKNGFGSPDNDYWIGLEWMYRLTHDCPMQMRIDMYGHKLNGENMTYYVDYSGFQIKSESEKYKLMPSGYSGNTGQDCFKGSSTRNNYGQKFTTYDQDNDPHPTTCTTVSYTHLTLPTKA